MNEKDLFVLITGIVGFVGWTYICIKSGVNAGIKYERNKKK
jgi:hypothetical protein